MKKMITLTMVSALFLPQVFLYADESHHPEEQGAKDETQIHGKTAQEGMMGKMAKHMQKMMHQMDEIHKTTDPGVREKLLQAHMQSMHEGMEMMRGMGGGMMMGKGVHQGSGAMGCDDQEARHQKMEGRMDMMQMMMEQMMQHRQAEKPHQIHRTSK